MTTLQAPFKPRVLRKTSTGVPMAWIVIDRRGKKASETFWISGTDESARIKARQAAHYAAYELNSKA